MCGIPAKKSRDRLDNGLLIDVPGIPHEWSSRWVVMLNKGGHGVRSPREWTA